jgi:hypothetical protein
MGLPTAFVKVQRSPASPEEVYTGQARGSRESGWHLFSLARTTSQVGAKRNAGFALKENSRGFRWIWGFYSHVM